MLKRLLSALTLSLGLLGTASAETAASAPAAPTTPDALISQISNEVLNAAKQDKTIQSGDLNRIMGLVNTSVLPHVNFERMTSSAMGRYWRQANAEQKARLQEEFKSLLVRTYAGALTKVKDQTLEVKPLRAKPEDTEVVVKTLVRGGKGDPIQLDYRMEKDGSTWKIYDVNVLGAWLVENYRNTFAQEITASGIDGLITKLAERNKAISAKK